MTLGSHRSLRQNSYLSLLSLVFLFLANLNKNHFTEYHYKTECKEVKNKDGSWTAQKLRRSKQRIRIIDTRETG